MSEEEGTDIDDIEFLEDVMATNEALADVHERDVETLTKLDEKTDSKNLP